MTGEFFFISQSHENEFAGFTHRWVTVLR